MRVLPSSTLPTLKAFSLKSFFHPYERCLKLSVPRLPSQNPKLSQGTHGNGFKIEKTYWEVTRFYLPAPRPHLKLFQLLFLTIWRVFEVYHRSYVK